MFETLSEESLNRYVRFFFKEICKIPVDDKRESFSTPLPGFEGIHFACVQDTVERLTD